MLVPKRAYPPRRQRDAGLPVPKPADSTPVSRRSGGLVFIYLYWDLMTRAILHVAELGGRLWRAPHSAQLQEYLAHKRTPPLGPYSRSMPRALRWS